MCRPLKGKVITLYSRKNIITVSENLKMSQEEKIKCSHYNSGYCKFAKKESGCKLYHPETTCEIPNCNNKKCPSRHQRPCRHGATCVFQIRCSYKHTVESISIVSTSKEVEQLRADITKLNEENNTKINILAKVHWKELEELRNENNSLKKENKDSIQQCEI